MVYFLLFVNGGVEAAKLAQLWNIFCEKNKLKLFYLFIYFSYNMVPYLGERKLF